MKPGIGLIDPGSKRTLLNETLPNVGLASIAAVLENQGFQVGVLDLGLAQPTEARQFLHNGFQIWGISATSFTFNAALEAASAIKKANPAHIVVVGGPHVSIEMGEVLRRHSNIDYAIYGEGEFSLLELVRLLEQSGRPSAAACQAVSGLIYRVQDEVQVNSPRLRSTNLDALPFPSFHLFDMSRHDNYPLLTSRGCPFGCSFCAIKAIWGSAWRPRSPENLIDELEQAHARYRLDHKIINIIDDCFNADPARALRFCDLLLERRLKLRWFPWGIRADRMTLPLARKMKAAGCIGVSVGIESADNGVLRAMGKKETLEEISRGLGHLSTAGLPVSATFMIGNIGDTPGTVMKTFAFAREQHFANVFFYLALPYPKTELHDYVQKHGRFLNTDYTRFHHFSSEPVFETPEFTAVERVEAYKLSRKLVARIRLREEVRRALLRLQHGNFRDLTWHRASKAWQRVQKHALDLVTGRGDRA